MALEQHPSIGGIPSIQDDAAVSSSDNANASGENHDKSYFDRPIVCVLEDCPPRTARSCSSGGNGKTTKGRKRCRMFRVIRSKGKALASGGFGVTIAHDSSKNEEASEETETSGGNNDHSEPQKPNDTPDSLGVESGAALDAEIDSTRRLMEEAPNGTIEKTQDPSKEKQASKSCEYLFIEEVVFLHEKGLLRALLPIKSNNETNDGAEAVALGDSNHGIGGQPPFSPLDTSQLYQILPMLGIDLAVYRVYSHLRSQDFRVLRHDPNRYEVLCLQRDDQERRERQRMERNQQQLEQQQEQQENEESSKNETEPNANASASLSLSSTNTRKQSLRLRHRIRESIQNAPPPSIPRPIIGQTKNPRDGNDVTAEEENDAIGICWDAYNPNSHFGKTHPGFPDFYVTATYYNVPTATFSELKNLLRNRCHGIPLKVATVSDSGTVVMFGVTDYGIPSLIKKPK